jgi:hypothetical protein
MQRRSLALEALVCSDLAGMADLVRSQNIRPQ